MTNCQRRFFSSAIFFRKIQKVRQFILGLKGEILILAKMELPFRFLEPPPPGRAKNPDFTRLETRSTKFPHYLFDFSLGLSPRTFLPIKKHFFFPAACGSWTWNRESRTFFGNPNLFQSAPIVLRGGMLKSGECWGRGESRGAGGRHSEISPQPAGRKIPGTDLQKSVTTYVKFTKSFDWKRE